jgi:hypothetical protein
MVTVRRSGRVSRFGGRIKSSSLRRRSARAGVLPGAAAVVRPLDFPLGTTECELGPPAACGDMWNLNLVKLPDLIATQPVPVANPTFVGGNVDTGFDRGNYNLAPVIRNGFTFNRVSIQRTLRGRAVAAHSRLLAVCLHP